MLPMDKYESPDYAFMVEYIKERELLLLDKYKHFIHRNAKTIGGVKSPCQIP